jgi:hypothetical protein
MNVGFWFNDRTRLLIGVAPSLRLPSLISDCFLRGMLRARLSAVSLRRTISTSSNSASTFAMANPWDIPPPPVEGDAERDITFTAVGQALTTWEEFELQFSNIFAANMW